MRGHLVHSFRWTLSALGASARRMARSVIVQSGLRAQGAPASSASHPAP